MYRTRIRVGMSKELMIPESTVCTLLYVPVSTSSRIFGSWIYISLQGPANDLRFYMRSIVLF